MQSTPNKAMDQNVNLERVKRVKTACSQCGVPQTFASRLRGELCAVCAAGMRLVQTDEEVELLRRFARELWAMRSLQPMAVETPAIADGWREKLDAWLRTSPAIVTMEEALRALDLEPAEATQAQRARARGILRDLGHVVRSTFLAPPQGLRDVQAALQRLGKAEVTIDELLPLQLRGDRRRIKIVARCLAYLGWKGTRARVDGGKRAKVFHRPADDA